MTDSQFLYQTILRLKAVRDTPRTESLVMLAQAVERIALGSDITDVRDAAVALCVEAMRASETHDPHKS